MLVPRTPLRRLLSSAAPGPGPRWTDFGFALDIDGVLMRGKTAIPGASDALRLLQRHNVPYVLMTNGGGALEHVKAEAVSTVLGIHVPESAVIVAHTPMRALAHKYKDDLVLFSGRKRIREVAKGYGFQRFLTVEDLHLSHPAAYPDVAPNAVDPKHHRRLTDKDRIAAVCCLMDPFNWEKELQILLDVVQSDGRLYHHSDTQVVALYMSCPDLQYSAEAPMPRLGAGAFSILLRHLFKEVTGRELQLTMFGKPFPVTYRYAEEVLERQVRDDAMLDAVRPPGHPLKAIYGVGDNPLTDIAGANGAGGPWRSALVRTGMFRGPGNDPVHPAHVVEDDILGVVKRLLAHHGI